MVTDPGPELADRADRAEENGQTAVFVAWDGQVRGVLTVADTIKPTARAAVPGCARWACTRCC